VRLRLVNDRIETSVGAGGAAKNVAGAVSQPFLS
jgi:hypothetical protein